MYPVDLRIPEAVRPGIFSSAAEVAAQQRAEAKRLRAERAAEQEERALRALLSEGPSDAELDAIEREFEEASFDDSSEAFDREVERMARDEAYARIAGCALRPTAAWAEAVKTMSERDLESLKDKIQKFAVTELEIEWSLRFGKPRWRIGRKPDGSITGFWESPEMAQKSQEKVTAFLNAMGAQWARYMAAVETRRKALDGRVPSLWGASAKELAKEMAARVQAMDEKQYGEDVGYLADYVRDVAAPNAAMDEWERNHRLWAETTSEKAQLWAKREATLDAAKAERDREARVRIRYEEARLTRFYDERGAPLTPAEVAEIEGGLGEEVNLTDPWGKTFTVVRKTRGWRGFGPRKSFTTSAMPDAVLRAVREGQIKNGLRPYTAPKPMLSDEAVLALTGDALTPELRERKAALLLARFRAPAKPSSGKAGKPAKVAAEKAVIQTVKAPAGPSVPPGQGNTEGRTDAEVMALFGEALTPALRARKVELLIAGFKA